MMLFTQSASRRSLRPALAIAFMLLASAYLPAGEGEVPSDLYTGVRFPYYKKGRLVSELKAETADALGPGTERARVNMQGVVIDVYDTSIATGDGEEEKRDKKPAGPPPLKMTIVSRTGVYERRKNEKGLMEDVAVLKEDVKAYRYGYATGKDGTRKRFIETTVVCDNATWNHTRQVLHGTGPVTITQPDSVLRGRDFIYYMRRPQDRKTPAADDTKAPPPRKDGLGGWIEFDRDVNMVFERSAAERIMDGGSDEAKDDKQPDTPPASSFKGGADETKAAQDRTFITCTGLASYDLDTREVHFQKNVVVTRPQMVIKSDYLRVQMGEGEEPLTEIIAWNRVTIEGREVDSAAKEGSGYIAVGDYARYTRADEKIVLTDKRDGHNPVVRVGTDVISDRLITLDATGDKMNVLAASGGSGETIFRSVLPENAPESQQVPPETRITYKGRMRYDRESERAVFTEKTHLVRGDLIVDADSLQIDMVKATAAGPRGERGIQTVVATDNVVITQGTRVSHATRAELEVARREVRLYGPPHPQVEEKNLFRFESKTIRSVQEAVAGQTEPRNYMEADGHGSGVFRTRRQDEAAGENDSEEVHVRFEEKMKYDETGRHFRFVNSDETRPVVRFTGNVVSISPDYVLHSEVLDVILEDSEILNPDGTKTTRREVSAVSAHGNATLHWGYRHCAGARIVRDMRKKVVVVYGDEKQKKDAEVWEEGGNSFVAPLIVATADGMQVHAQGPGMLVLPDDENEKKARVQYEGTAIRVRLNEREDKVTFTKNVKMTRDDMTVNGDRLVAYLTEDPDPAKAAEWAMENPEGKTANPRRLDRVEVEGNVTVTQPTRVAVGAWGQVLVRPAGDIITLKGDDSRNADIRDKDGVHLISPKMVANQGRDIVTAEGPGIVFVQSHEKQSTTGPKTLVNYRLEFRRKMVYNPLARKLKFYQNVRLLQDNVNGQCDELELILEEAESDDEDEGASLMPRKEGEPPDLRVKEMFAYGGATFQRFEPVTDETSHLDRSNMPGKTLFTKSDRAHYDIAKRTITLSGGPPRPTAIQQVTENMGGGKLDKTRHQMWADTLIMDVESGTMMGPRARVKRQRVSSEGGIRFKDEE